MTGSIDRLPSNYVPNGIWTGERWVSQRSSAMTFDSLELAEQYIIEHQEELCP